MRSARIGLAAYIQEVYSSDVAKVGAKRERRINTRVRDEQERLARAAADLSGESKTGFVLSVATERATDVVAREQWIEISVEAFAGFVAALDGPAEDMATVRRYAAKASQIPAN